MDMVEEAFHHSTFSKSMLGPRGTPATKSVSDIESGSEEIFGWAKSVACFRKTRFRGGPRTRLAAHLVAAAHNLLRISKLIPA
jgi:hypothetical protein